MRLRMRHCGPTTSMGRRNSNGRTFGASSGEKYHSRRRLGFDSHDQTKPSLAALVRPLTRPFLPFGERLLSAQSGGLRRHHWLGLGSAAAAHGKRLSPRLGCRPRSGPKRTARLSPDPSPPRPSAERARPGAPATRAAAGEALARRTICEAGAEPMIAVELAHDFDHLIDGLHVARGHRTVGDEHRFVQAADLELDEFVRPIDDPARQQRRLALARPFHRYPFAGRDFLDGHAGRQFLDKPEITLRQFAFRYAPALRSGFSSLFVRISRQRRFLSFD